MGRSYAFTANTKEDATRTANIFRRVVAQIWHRPATVMGVVSRDSTHYQAIVDVCGSEVPQITAYANELNSEA